MSDDSVGRNDIHDPYEAYDFALEFIESSDGLNLNFEDLPGLRVIPPEIKSLSNLRRLVISGESRPGSSRVEDLSPIAALANLEELIVCRAPIYSMDPLAGLKKLRKIIAHELHFTDLDFVRHLPSLEALYMVGSKVADFSAIATAKTMAMQASNFIEQHDLRRGGDYDWESQVYRGSDIGLYFRESEEVPSYLSDLKHKDNNAIIAFETIARTREKLGYTAIDSWLSQAEGEETFDASTVPEPENGPTISFSSSGKLTLVNTGLPSDTDITEIEASRSVLLAMLDQLDQACAGSNSAAFVRQAVAAYKNILDLDITDTSIDLLHAYGLQLENTNVRLQKRIAEGYEPDQSIAIGASLDSVIAIHGAMIMGTERGQELVKRGREFRMTLSEQIEYKEKSVAFAESVVSSPEVFEEDAQVFIERVNEDVAEGRDPNQSTALAETTNSNVIRSVVKTSLIGLGAVGSVVTVSEALAPGLVAALVEAAGVYLTKYKDVILGTAALPGTDAAWLEAFYRWRERQSNYSD